MNEGYPFFVDLITDQERLELAGRGPTLGASYQIGNILEHRRDSDGRDLIYFSVYAETLAGAAELRRIVARMRQPTTV